MSVKFGTQANQEGPLEASDILTPEQLATRLQLPLSWVYKKSAESGMPVLHCGRYLRFAWPEVCAWLRNNSPIPKSSPRKRRRKTAADKLP
jgi:hypothetical protein